MRVDHRMVRVVRVVVEDQVALTPTMSALSRRLSSLGSSFETRAWAFDPRSRERTRAL